jgi:hypothetical protein
MAASERVSGIALPQQIVRFRLDDALYARHRLRKAVDGPLEQSVSLALALHGGGAAAVIVGAHSIYKMYILKYKIEGLPWAI